MFKNNLEKKIRTTIIVLLILLLTLVVLTICLISSYRIVRSGRNYVYAEETLPGDDSKTDEEKAKENIDEFILINSVTPNSTDSFNVSKFMPGDVLADKVYSVTTTFYGRINLCYGAFKIEGDPDIADNAVSKVIHFNVGIDENLDGYYETTIDDITLSDLSDPSKHIVTTTQTFEKTAKTINYRVRAFIPTTVNDNFSNDDDINVQTKNIKFNMSWYVGEPPTAPIYPPPSQDGYLIPNTGVIGSLYIITREYGAYLLIALIVMLSYIFVYKKKIRIRNGK